MSCRVMCSRSRTASARAELIRDRSRAGWASRTRVRVVTRLSPDRQVSLLVVEKSPDRSQGMGELSGGGRAGLVHQRASRGLGGGGHGGVLLQLAGGQSAVDEQ